MDDTDDQDPKPPRFDDEDAPQPEVARIRRKVHSAGRDGRVRSKTIAPKRQTRDEKRLSELLVYPDDVDRPSERRLLFLKSWNEWAEGNHLEPDLKSGLCYLEAVARANLIVDKEEPQSNQMHPCASSEKAAIPGII